MNFGEILDQWDMQTQRPYGKKRLRNDTKNPAQIDPAKENTQRMNPMDRWMNRHGIYDKDAENAEETGAGENFAEKRKLRAMRPQAEIDLHGMTLEEAYAALVTFFDDAVQKSYQKILIIHGKGNHSENGPVLARFVQKFLESHVHAGETGHPKGRDGGTGSTWVILK